MGTQGCPITVLVVDDDLEDCMLVRDAMAESRLANDLRFAHDGDELLAYLRHEGQYADAGTAPRPGLILLDLNMPRKDGREALQEIKADPQLRRIPVVILTSSQAEEDICQSYELGANAYVTRPVAFEALVSVLGDLGKYWIEIVQLQPD